MVVYSLPGLSGALGLNLFYAGLQNNEPELMRDGVRIGSIYGNFPRNIINGGRAQINAARYTAEQVEAAFTAVDEAGLSSRLTLTNMLVRPEHLEDPYFLMIMGIARRHHVEAILYSDVVDDFIRKRYPGMLRTLSTTFEILDVEELNRKTEEFDYVVMNYKKNRDNRFLTAIRSPSKVEVIVNEFCSIDCPCRTAHYLHFSQDQLAGIARPFKCVQPHTAELLDQILHHYPGHPVRLTVDDVRRMNEEHGIEYFKIAGRGEPLGMVIESLTYYLVKDEAHDEVVRRAKAMAFASEPTALRV